MRASFLRSIVAGVAATAIIATLQAQSKVDIGLFRSGQELEVRLRPEADFNGILSGLLFSIRWDRNTGATLGAVVQDDATRNYVPVKALDLVKEDGPFMYQSFGGVSFMSMADAGARFEAGKEYVIARIPVRGNAEFLIATDTWTKTPQNNGDYYVSLGGVDRTGVVYKNMGGSGSNEDVFSIMPNPNRGQFTLVIPMGTNEDMWFEIFSSNGQLVYTEKPNAGEGTFRKDIDITGTGSGNYMLRIHRNGNTETHKIVVNN